MTVTSRLQAPREGTLGTGAKGIRFEGVAMQFGGVVALQPIDLTIAPGEFFTLLGPSGSGKTTLLNITAGFLVPTAGRVLIGDVDATLLEPPRRNIGMVFQNYALFPHLTVFENVAYGLRVRRVPESEIRRRVHEILGIVQLQGFERRWPNQLSGGQQQRVALARALVIEPAVLLMDEPLGALDRQLRKQVQLEIRHIQRRLGRTAIYVTHDQEEALVMSNRIGILRNGQLMQVGTPQQLYEEPANAFVAGFLGESNLLAGTVGTIADGRATLHIEQLSKPIQGIAGPQLSPGVRGYALIRPEHIRINEPPYTDIPATIEEIVYLGETISINLRLPGNLSVWAKRFADRSLPADPNVQIGWHPDQVRILID
jgi:spermidine/putrescine ABC transporter ATP-binding subunit